MVRINVQQVTIAGHGGLVAGEPEGDTTKVVFAAVDDPMSVMPIALVVAAGESLSLEVPDDAVIRIVEKPKDQLP